MENDQCYSLTTFKKIKDIGKTLQGKRKKVILIVTLLYAGKTALVKL